MVVVERLPGFVEVHGPGIRVAGVLVPEHPRHGPLPPDLAEDRVEPQLVTEDPAAVHPTRVVHVDELERRPKARILERLRVIAGLQPALLAAEIELTAEVVRPFA